jgi:hypothetical protein
MYFFPSLETSHLVATAGMGSNVRGSFANQWLEKVLDNMVLGHSGCDVRIEIFWVRRHCRYGLPAGLNWIFAYSPQSQIPDPALSYKE